MPHHRITRLRLAAVALASMVSLAACAQPAPPPGHAGPPAEAVAACKTLSAGNACSFVSPHGSMTGACWAPEGKPLACRPTGAPAEGHSKPKQAP